MTLHDWIHSYPEALEKKAKKLYNNGLVFDDKTELGEAEFSIEEGSGYTLKLRWTASDGEVFEEVCSCGQAQCLHRAAVGQWILKERADWLAAPKAKRGRKAKTDNSEEAAPSTVKAKAPKKVKEPKVKVKKYKNEFEEKLDQVSIEFLQEFLLELGGKDKTLQNRFLRFHFERYSQTDSLVEDEAYFRNLLDQALSCYVQRNKLITTSRAAFTRDFKKIIQAQAKRAAQGEYLPALIFLKTFSVWVWEKVHIFGDTRQGTYGWFEEALKILPFFFENSPQLSSSIKTELVELAISLLKNDFHYNPETLAMLSRIGLSFASDSQPLIRLADSLKPHLALDWYYTSILSSHTNLNLSNTSLEIIEDVEPKSYIHNLPITYTLSHYPLHLCFMELRRKAQAHDWPFVEKSVLSNRSPNPLFVRLYMEYVVYTLDSERKVQDLLKKVGSHGILYSLQHAPEFLAMLFKLSGTSNSYQTQFRRLAERIAGSAEAVLKPQAYSNFMASGVQVICPPRTLAAMLVAHLEETSENLLSFMQSKFVAELADKAPLIYSFIRWTMLPSLSWTDLPYKPSSRLTGELVWMTREITAYEWAHFPKIIYEDLLFRFKNKSLQGLDSLVQKRLRLLGEKGLSIQDLQDQLVKSLGANLELKQTILVFFKPLLA